jgi:hypothetical protein
MLMNKGKCFMHNKGEAWLRHPPHPQRWGWHSAEAMWNKGRWEALGVLPKQWKAYMDQVIFKRSWDYKGNATVSIEKELKKESEIFTGYKPYDLESK